MATTSWDTLHKRAKHLEGRLETAIQRYASIGQKINADFLCDEENSLMEHKEEQEYSADIERDLSELSECINGMRGCVSGPNSHQQEGLIKRYKEIHFDYANEFANISRTIHHKRESMELFKSSKDLPIEEQDSSIVKLLRERSNIAASMKSINDVISQAFDTKNTLTSQRNTLNNSAGGLSNLAGSVPGFNRLIDGIQKKKSRDNMIVGLVIAVCLCFVIWWVFLR